ncbi:hypothetical protein J8M97_20095 [Gordonia polyisoprenivorans]|uniref:hypothetical protein n=1 Tax=Gordonia polyisoprenivorans TaxID=84595 RepID=UPI0003A8C009|nr:hypothetical protein [Gordonia polyisoprenivorans]QUD82023.1 hypothetical protein J8M97_20095 [Gordonia polyisoprenivorans]WCB38233.1 hypothetical protein PHA63_03530 [Gordonia polyisoprenivorans]
MRSITTTARRRVAAALVAMTVAGGTTVALAPAASAAPPTASGIHRVDELGDLSYQALFAVGVQVYEYAGVIRENNPYNPPLFYTVLRRLHTPTQGTPGSRRYGFLGAALPETFAMYPSAGGPAVLAQPGGIFGVNPRTLTLTPNSHLSQCLNYPVGPIGPLTGGGALVTAACFA